MGREIPDVPADFLAEFEALVRQSEAIELVIRPVDAWILLSQLQLALRHPANVGPGGQRARELARRLQALVADPGRWPALARVADLGWDPAHDESA